MKKLLILTALVLGLVKLHAQSKQDTVISHAKLVVQNDKGIFVDGKKIPAKYKKVHIKVVDRLKLAGMDMEGCKDTSLEQ